MKDQIQNSGALGELKVSIEKEVLESFIQMEKNTKIPLADLVVIALKRFRSAHCDYEGIKILST